MAIPPCSRLLIPACSVTKRSDAGRIPAVERYDGPLWRSLRHCDPGGWKARVAFLSARYGFRDACSPIENYDARMTEDVADRMIAGGTGMRWPRLRSQRRVMPEGEHPGVHIATMVRRGDRPSLSGSERRGYHGMPGQLLDGERSSARLGEPNGSAAGVIMVWWGRGWRCCPP